MKTFDPHTFLPDLGWLGAFLLVALPASTQKNSEKHCGLVVFSHPSEKYELVNWEDDIPKIYGKIKLMFQTTNQIGIGCIISVF